MAKSKYDRNVDKGAAQQRNTGQGTTATPAPASAPVSAPVPGGHNKPGMTPEEMMGTGQQSSGGSKNQSDSVKRGHESSWRPKPGGDNT